MEKQKLKSNLKILEKDIIEMNEHISYLASDLSIPDQKQSSERMVITLILDVLSMADSLEIDIQNLFKQKYKSGG